MSSDAREFESGSGNVFADIGFSDGEERLAKADLASSIASIIESRGLTQARAAEITGVPQPKISLLTRGILKDFSTDRLYRILNSLGVSVAVVLTKQPSGKPGVTTVSDDTDSGKDDVDGPVHTTAR